MAIKEIEFKVELTPQLLAQGFWELNSEQQALFFDELGTVMASSNAERAHWCAEVQWTWLAKALIGNPQGFETFKHMAETVLYTKL